MTTKTLLVLLVVLIALAFYACGQKTTNANVTHIDTDEFARLMQEHPEYVVVDVRTAQEQAAGRIAGARSIDVQAPDFAQKIAALDKDKTYLVYCRSGGRSTRACSIMAEQGFAHLYNLEGGYTAWSARNQ